MSRRHDGTKRCATMTGKQRKKGRKSVATKATGTPQPAATPANRPVIMVTVGNGSVERQVRSAGGAVLDAGYDMDKALDRLALADGLLITGGGDVNPYLYSETRHKATQPISASRDFRELMLLGAARDMGLPVMGICRGLQVIAVESGGTLHQHVPDKVNHDNHDCGMMPVRTVRGSAVARALGEYPNVLHLHHQSVRRMPAGFQVTARHLDGTVEAIESVDGRVVAVQFHPESVMGDMDKSAEGWRLFDAFVSSAKRYKRRARRYGRIVPKDLDAYMRAWPVAEDAYYAPPKGVSYNGKGPWWDDDDFDFERVKVMGPKVTDKRSGSATITRTAEGPKMVVNAEQESGDALPVAWCGTCGIPFDIKQDHADHMDFFHPVTTAVVDCPF